MPNNETDKNTRRITLSTADRTVSHTLVVGLEVHCQLLTRSKLFCGCANRFNPDNPNVQTCPVCLGLPGSLPVMNRTAFELSLKTALALDCDIPRFTKWDRKQYYYPDLPKAYQISQYDLPFSIDGWLDVEVDPQTGEKTRVRLIRVHLEEDAGKNIHDQCGDSRVDLNRAGTPLLEIVAHPDIRSVQAARRFLEELKLLLMYLGVSDCNMQEGSLRCDANVNLHITGAGGKTVATPLVEVKNMNSFRNVELALEYEEQRQLEQWQESGLTIGQVSKQTRGWDAERGVTFAQRGKEEASDYRYFPDPDLVPVTVSEQQLDAIRANMCELPAARRERYREEHNLSAYDAAVIIDQGAVFSDYFETVAGGCRDGKLAANWLTQDVLRELNECRTDIAEFPIPADVLAGLLQYIAAGQITTRSAREVFTQLMADAAAGRCIDSGAIEGIIESRGLAVVADTARLGSIIEAVISRNQRIAADFRGGTQGAIGPLIGQVMGELKGADPRTVRKMLIEKLESPT